MHLGSIRYVLLDRMMEAGEVRHKLLEESKGARAPGLGGLQAPPGRKVKGGRVKEPW